MATAKQLRARKKFAAMARRRARLARKKKKRSSPRPRPTTTRTVKPMARRRRASRRKGGSRKKYVSISLLNIGQMAMQYSNLTGKPLGSILDQLTAAILGGQGDIFEILMDEMMAAVKNITDNPFQVAAKGAVIAGFFAIIRSFAGRKKIIGIGKFRITV